VDEVAATARDILDEMLDKMGFRVDVMVRSTADPIILDVEGENLGVLIGRRGDSLSALQFMLNLMLSKRFRHWPHVVIDIQGYRARREQSLRSLALRVAQRVRRNRRAFTLEAMPANDRRIIHLTLRERSDVETYSIGEGAARRVVVAPRR
jgi:spoIIIJ-associated protein